jgi:hypothetical protein
MDKSRMAIPASFLGSIIGFVLVSTSLSFSFYLLVPVALFLIINPIITTTLLPNK